MSAAQKLGFSGSASHSSLTHRTEYVVCNSAILYQKIIILYTIIKTNIGRCKIISAESSSLFLRNLRLAACNNIYHWVSRTD